MDIDQAEQMKKSTWKNGVKTKLKKKIQQRLTDDFKKKSRAKTIQNNKQQMKEYIKKGNTDDLKDMYMWNVEKNYSRNDTDTICPICRKEEDTTAVHSMCWIVKQNLRK